VALAETGALLATAETALLSLDREMTPVRMPSQLREQLLPSPDPIRI
jgi:acyl-CoA thioesterase FadM